MRKEFIERVKGEEGFSPTSFWDDAPGGGGGQWTWGYGTKAPGPDQNITKEQAEIELIKELLEAEGDYGAVFATEPPGLTQARYESIIDMLFNLGLSRFGEFHYTIAAIKEGRWLAAAAHAQASLWYRQVGKRAKRIVEEFRTGIDKYATTLVVPAVGETPTPAKDSGSGVEVGGGWIHRLLGILRQLFLVRT